MSTQEPSYGTTAERLKALAPNEAARERISALATRYWEIAAYALVGTIAAVMRFWNLGARAYHHDESLHGFFSYQFTQGLRYVFSFGSQGQSETYKHVPFMHGPFQFLGNGLMMFIFQDGNFQGRSLAATMGTGLVLLPFLFRKQLGTIGALATAIFLAFSPTLLYYSRFTREDIYTAFWTFGIVIFMWRYIATKENKFLYLTAGFVSMSFLTKETTYMTAGSFLAFLDFMFATHLAGKIRAKRPMSEVQHSALLIGLLPVAWLVALFWPLLARQRAMYDLDEMPAEANLLVVIGTLSAPMYAAGVQFLPGFGEAWKNRAGANGASHTASQEWSVAIASIVFLIALAVALGMLWRPKVWLIAAAAFWVPVVVLSTTFFSNGPGFMSVVWGSFDYWISQQAVARGNQPEYYYFMTIPVYEFLPLILASAAAFYFTIRGRLDHALIIAGGFVAIIVLLLLPPGPLISKAPLFHVWLPFGIVLLAIMTFKMEMLPRFLMFWAVVTSLTLTVASEKMPWLNVHIALPLAVIAGLFVGRMLSTSDLRADLPKIERVAPYLYAIVATALSVLVFVIVGPFTLASTGAWILAAVAAVAFFWAFSSYSRRTGLQVALVGLIAALMIFTIRAGVLSSLDQADVSASVAGYSPGLSQDDKGALPVELLVYTQTSGDIPILVDKLAAYGRQTGKGVNQPVVVDSVDGFTWPWAWYLRNYKNVQYTTITQGYQPPAGAVLFVASQNASNLSLGDGYNPGIQYHHRRWFPESYRGSNGTYSTRDFFRALVSKSQLSYWLDYFIRRTPPDTLGTVDGMAFFPKDAKVIPTRPVGPTVRREGTQLVIGGQGSAPGQLNQPSGVETDAQGNIYVADTSNDRIDKYDKDGKFVASAGGFAQAGGASLKQPWSIAVAADGTVFVADTFNWNIIKLDANLKQVQTWGTGCTTVPDCNEFQLFGPRDIALTPDGHVLITDTGNGRVIEYTQDGKFVNKWGTKFDPTKGGTPGPLDLQEPVGLAIALNGDVYIADYWNKRIVRVNKDFAPIGAPIPVPSWGSNAVTNRPYLALLPDGRLLATDPANGKVLVFAANGNPAGTYALPAEGNTTPRPVGITTDATSVYVSDGAGSVVRKIPLAEVVK
ncbi:MAG: TIGR03663 family protein [Dehalococcoidia bacterium]|nr:TIGR03663 family protein [Dehalococcoidia bacterium]